MLITPFRVRLASKKGGYKLGLIGTVVGEDWVKNPETGNPLKMYQVLWYSLNEETGEENVSDYPAPSVHTSDELRADSTEFEEVEEGEEYEDEEPEINA